MVPRILVLQLRSKQENALEEHIVTCIARQRTDKHLATEYMHATIELRMLLLVAR
jgi:hypothetical protein